MSKEFTSMMWEKNDTLRNMTLKFNQAVKVLEQLQYYSENLSPAYQDEMRNLTNEVERQLSGVSNDIASAVQSITAESIGLGYVNNTSDEDKPISNAQQAEFNNIKNNMLTSSESEFDGVEAGEDPEISDPIKEYINAAITAAIREIAPEKNVTSYGIATKNTLGVVRASDDIEVNPNNGRMSIPALSDVISDYSIIKNTFDNLILIVSQNSGRIKQFTQLQQGSTTGDAELADGRVGFNGTEYDTIGTAIRMQYQLLIESINEVKNTYKEIINSLKKDLSLENVDRVKSDEKIRLRLSDLESSSDNIIENYDSLVQMIGNISGILSNRGESDLCSIIHGLVNTVNNLTTRVNELSLKIDIIEASINNKGGL